MEEYTMTMEQAEEYGNLCVECYKRGIPLLFPKDYYEQFILNN